ncbi:MAG: thioredoxin TrxC [Pyrinomonadaceae bacterium]
MPKTLVITCQNCGAKNRVDSGRINEAVCGKCKASIKVLDIPIELTDSNFTSEVLNSKLPVLVDFWAAWCGPCRMVAPLVEEIAKEMAGKAKIGKIDVDQNPQTSSRFQVRSIPTLIIYKSGKEVDRIVGAGSKDAMVSRLNNFI